MPHQEARYGSGGLAANARFVAGTVAVVAFANLAAVLLSEGFTIGVFGIRVTVDSPGWLLVLLVASLAVFRVLSFHNEDPSRFFQVSCPWGCRRR
ncbi:MAG: hypothetical protein J7M19_02130 [Planctomycetes bacterium]|nr:hypothetical protein [Planctomycetota bacterium]